MKLIALLRRVKAQTAPDFETFLAILEREGCTTLRCATSAKEVGRLGEVVYGATFTAQLAESGWLKLTEQYTSYIVLGFGDADTERRAEVTALHTAFLRVRHLRTKLGRGVDLVDQYGQPYTFSDLAKLGRDVERHDLQPACPEGILSKATAAQPYQRFFG